ncbi:MAG: ABC-F family ATP-binding cassette domain-containing protein, partial [Bacilli bacterium]|nr:ABC-F family ATP-binding cassette domain-containing protein [Bacilli bacterium]
MTEISLTNVTKTFGFKNILNGLNIEIKTGDRVSIIGENGCGKTTILNIISSKESVDSGTVSIRKGLKIGYLSQQPENIYNNKTVKEILYDSFSELLEYENRLKTYEKRMAKEPENIALINKYLDLQDKFMKLGGYEINSSIEKISHGLNINHLLESNFNVLSGGEQKRVVLASIIVKKPELLLLDEPTNHLDIKTLEWLEDFLNKYNGTIVIVSHDRYFLDRVTTKTILIEHGKAIIFHGNYSKYLVENEDRIEREFKEYKDQQKLIIALKKKIKQLEEFGRLAYPLGESFYRRAENIRKRLERIEVLDRPQVKKELPINLDFDKRSGKDVLVIKDYDLTIEDKTLINNINIKISYGD